MSRRAKVLLAVLLALVMVLAAASVGLAKPGFDKAGPGKGPKGVNFVKPAGGDEDLDEELEGDELEEGLEEEGGDVEVIEEEVEAADEDGEAVEEDEEDEEDQEEEGEGVEEGRGQKNGKNGPAKALKKQEHKVRIREKQALKAEEKGLKIFVNGMHPVFDQPPVIKEGRVLVPVRAVTTALGAAVDYDSETKTVTIVKEGITVILKLGDLTATVNGEPLELDVPAASVNARTVVPLRFIAEALGATVSYDQESGTVNIEDENEDENENEEEGTIEENEGEISGEEGETQEEPATEVGNTGEVGGQETTLEETAQGE